VNAGRWQSRLAFGAASLVLVIAAAVPLAAVLIQAASTRLRGLTAVATPRTVELFGCSLMLALEVTILALLGGVPLGAVFGCARIPGRRVLLALHAMPVFLPPFLLALGWFHVLGREGLLGSATTSEWLFGRAGLVFVLATALGPLVTLCTVIGVRGVDPALLDAGRGAASPLTVLTRIVVPLAWPAIAVGGLLVFTLAFAEVAVPMFLRVEVYPAAVFARLGSLVYEPAEAAVLALPVVALAFLIVGAERTLARRHGEALSSRRGKHEAMSLGGATWFAAALAASGAALSWLPLVGLLVRALRGHGFVDAWLRLGNAVENSLLVAGVAASVGTAVAVVVGHGLARGSKVARGLDVLTLAAFLTPAAVGGVGAITAWNRPATAWVYGTTVALVLCLLGRYSVVAIRVFSAGVRQRPESHEAAAATCGAGYLRRLFGVVVPESWRALAGAWLLGAVFCLRDVETAILVYPPGGETLPVRIFTLEANGPEPSVAALALFHVALTAVVLAAMAVLLGRREAQA